MRVVVVEDHPDIAELLTIAVDQMGDEVRTVTEDFAQVLDPDFWSDADVAVVDLSLGPVSGAQILLWLCNNRPDIRRVVLSAHADIDDSVKELAHVVLLKPSGVSVIKRAIHGDADG